MGNQDGLIVSCFDRGGELEVHEQVWESQGWRHDCKIVTCEHDLCWKLRVVFQRHGVGRVRGGLVRDDSVEAGAGQSNVLGGVQGEVL